MTSITVRNVPDEVHRALRVRAARHGLSAEAEIRVRLGDALAALGRQAGVTDEDIAALDQTWDTSPANPMTPAARRQFGTLVGKIVVPDDFDDQLPDDMLDAFEGR